MVDINVPITLKRKKYNEHVIPTLTYGCETWRSLTKEQEKDLREAQISMERLMLNKKPTEKVKQTEIRLKTGFQDIIQVIKWKKWKWAGYVARMELKWPKLMTMWQPKTEIKKQLTMGRWSDEIEAFVGPNWMERAQKIIDWNQYGDAFIYQWADKESANPNKEK
jgi:hypothetical protein